MFSNCNSKRSPKSTVTVNEKKIDMDAGSDVTVNISNGSGNKVVINGDLEYADRLTLARSFRGRTQF